MKKFGGEKANSIKLNFDAAFFRKHPFNSIHRQSLLYILIEIVIVVVDENSIVFAAYAAPLQLHSDQC